MARAIGATLAKKLIWPGKPTVPTLMAMAVRPPATMTGRVI
jgi:hypothetical protein